MPGRPGSALPPSRTSPRSCGRSSTSSWPAPPQLPSTAGSSLRSAATSGRSRCSACRTRRCGPSGCPPTRPRRCATSPPRCSTGPSCCRGAGCRARATRRSRRGFRASAASGHGRPTCSSCSSCGGSTCGRRAISACAAATDWPGTSPCRPRVSCSRSVTRTVPTARWWPGTAGGRRSSTPARPTAPSPAEHGVRNAWRPAATDGALSTLLPHPPERAAGASGDFRPIADYGLLADCNSSALVDRAGSIDWLCLPRYDSDALFARVLDPGAGHWSIRPAGEFTARRRYLDGTLVIETTFTTETGTVRLRDAMAFAAGQRGHDLGYDAPHEVLRAVEGVAGDVELVLELAARPEYGLLAPLIRLEAGGARTFGSGRMAVRSAVPLELSDGTLRAAFTVGAGERAGFSLRWASAE